MTAMEKIKTIADSVGLPNEPDVLTHYEELPKQWIAYNYAYQGGDEFADDAPQEDTASVQVHLYSKISIGTTKLQKKIQRALFEAGFTYPEITVNREDSYRHVIFECEIDEEREE